MKKKQVQIFRLEDRVLFDAAMAEQIESMNHAAEQQAEAQAEDTENGSSEAEDSFSEAAADADGADAVETLTVSAADADDDGAASDTISAIDFTEAPLSPTAVMTAEIQNDAQDDGGSSVTIDLLDDSSSLSVSALPVSSVSSASPALPESASSGDSADITVKDCHGNLLVFDSGYSDPESIYGSLDALQDYDVLILNGGDEADFLDQINAYIDKQTTVVSETTYTDNAAVEQSIAVEDFSYDSTSDLSVDEQLNEYLAAQSEAVNTAISDIIDGFADDVVAGDVEYTTVDKSYIYIDPLTSEQTVYNYQVTTKVSVANQTEHVTTTTTYRQYNSVQFFTSGSGKGYLLINGQKYTSSEAELDADKWEELAGHMDTGSQDLVFYGSEIASGAEGQELLAAIRAGTGNRLDIAASEDATGYTGNWTLEYTIGNIEYSTYLRVSSATTSYFELDTSAKTGEAWTEADGEVLTMTEASGQFQSGVRYFTRSGSGTAVDPYIFSEQDVAEGGDIPAGYYQGTQMTSSDVYSDLVQYYHGTSSVRLDSLSQAEADSLIQSRLSAWDVVLATDNKYKGSGEIDGNNDYDLRYAVKHAVNGDAIVIDYNVLGENDYYTKEIYIGAELEVNRNVSIYGISGFYEDENIVIRVVATGTDPLTGEPVIIGDNPGSMYRVFNITGGNVYLDNLTVLGGHVIAVSDDAIGGGTIAVGGTETQNVHFRDLVIANGWSDKGGNLWYDNTAENSSLTLDNVTIFYGFAGSYDSDLEVAIADGIGGNAYLNGTVTINGGAIYGSVGIDTAGTAGAVYAGPNTVLTINGTDISDTTARNDGGAVYLASGAAMTLRNGSVFGTMAYGNGGAVYAENGTSLVFEGVRFYGSSASTGGAVYTAGNIAVSDSTFGAPHSFYRSADTEKVEGKTYYLYNPGTDSYEITLFNDSLELYESIADYSSNAALEGGAIYVDGGRLELNASSLYDNYADQGGAIYLNGNATLIAANSTFYANTAEQQGGAIYNAGNADVLLVSDTFAGNIANGANGGAALYTDGPDSVATVVNTLFAENRAESVLNDFTGKANLYFTYLMTGFSADVVNMAGSVENAGITDIFGYNGSDPGWTFDYQLGLVKLARVYGGAADDLPTRFNGVIVKIEGLDVSYTSDYTDPNAWIAIQGVFANNVGASYINGVLDTDQTGATRRTYSPTTVTFGAYALPFDGVNYVFEDHANDSDVIEISITSDVVNEFDGQISLREALLYFRENPARIIGYDSAAGTTIWRNPVFMLNSTLVIDFDLTLDGMRSLANPQFINIQLVDSAATEPVIRITSGTVNLSHISLGSMQSSVETVIAVDGYATFTLNNSLISSDGYDYRPLIFGGISVRGQDADHLANVSINEVLMYGNSAASGSAVTLNGYAKVKIFNSTLGNSETLKLRSYQVGAQIIDGEVIGGVTVYTAIDTAVGTNQTVHGYNGTAIAATAETGAEKASNFATVLNATLAYNGAGIAFDGGTLFVISSTIARNTGNGISLTGVEQVIISNSIISGNGDGTETFDLDLDAASSHSNVLFAYDTLFSTVSNGNVITFGDFGAEDTELVLPIQFYYRDGTADQLTEEQYQELPAAEKVLYEYDESQNAYIKYIYTAFSFEDASSQIAVYTQNADGSHSAYMDGSSTQAVWADVRTRLFYTRTGAGTLENPYQYTLITDQTADYLDITDFYDCSGAKQTRFQVYHVTGAGSGDYGVKENFTEIFQVAAAEIFTGGLVLKPAAEGGKAYNITKNETRILWNNAAYAEDSRRVYINFDGQWFNAVNMANSDSQVSTEKNSFIGGVFVALEQDTATPLYDHIGASDKNAAYRIYESADRHAYYVYWETET